MAWEGDCKQRIVQELVPGRQVTLAHIIASPDQSLYAKLGLGSAPEKVAGPAAIGILTVTPGETAIILADIGIKSAGVALESVNMASGSLLLTGSLSQVESALAAVLDYVEGVLGYAGCPMTKT